MFYRDKNLNAVRIVFRLQLIFGIGFSILCLLVTQQLRDFLSAFLGFVLVIVPTAIYVMVAFVNGLIVLPSVALQRHKKAIMYRFMVSLGLFSAVCFGYKNCNFLLLFLAYLVTLSGYWFSLLKTK